MAPVRPDLASRVRPDPYVGVDGVDGDADHFDRLPESLLLVVFNRIGDVKTLGRCCVLSRRFHAIVLQVERVLIRVDCVISDDDDASAASSADKARGGGAGGSFSTLLRFIFGGIVKRIQDLAQFLGPKHSSLLSSPAALALGGRGRRGEDEESDQGEVTHHSPTQVLKNFAEIRFLRIELPSGELGLEDGALLKWRADFGSTLERCVILGAMSVSNAGATKASTPAQDAAGNGGGEDSGSIPESFYTDGSLRVRVVWTISSLIAASSRHYLLKPIISEHRTLESLVLTDSDAQGELRMNREQLEELRVKPLSASSAAKRTMVPALNMRMWYAPQLELPDGMVLKGATLVAIRPSGRTAGKDASDLSWVSSALEEPYGTAGEMLVKRRTYCLEMNSF